MLSVLNPTVVFDGPREVVVEDREIPEPGPGQVQIRTELTLISIGTELSLLDKQPADGKKWAGLQKYPLVPGYSNIGTVVKTGPEVDNDLVGRRVQSYGSHARYVVQGLDLVRPVHRDISSEQAVFGTMAEIALNGVRRSGVGLGSSVVVFGLGILGQLAVRFTRICGARPVVGVDPAESRRKLLPREPAVIAVDPDKDSLRSIVAELTRGRMADIVIELTGVPEVIPAELELLRNQGTLAIVSGPRGETTVDLHDLCNAPSITILGIHNSSHATEETPATPWTKNRDVELFFDLIADGDLDIADLVSETNRYDQAPAIYQRLLQDRTPVMGLLLDWTDE